jgi:rhodanese-related sulfurtransferase
MALWAAGAQLRAFLAVVVFAISGVAIAAASDAPQGVTAIQAEEVIRLALDHDDLILIDSRTPVDREMGYIEDSISLPDDQTSCERLSKLSKHHDQPMIFYCNGIKCSRSRDAVQKASACGYSKLYWFKGGYQEWQEKRFPVLRSH